MADAHWTPGAALEPVAVEPPPAPVAEAQWRAQLRREPYAFSFHSALRWMDCAHPELPRIGTARSPRDELIRVGQDASMRFEPSTVSSYDRPKGAEFDRLGVAFWGLFGPNGALPLHLTDYALERQRQHKDTTFLAFVDLFHHRMLCLFHRAWASGQPALSYDRPDQDRFGDYLAALCGLGLPSLRQRDAMPDAAKLHFCGRLLQAAKNADGLLAIVREYFRVAVDITEFVGEWLPIAAADRCRLGASPETGTLGQTAVAGAFAFECQHRFRLHIGPLTLDRFEHFLPGCEPLDTLVAVVRNYIGDELVWDLQLSLRHDQVPEPRLGANARLGWTTWIGNRRAEQDADDLILDPLRRR